MPTTAPHPLDAFVRDPADRKPLCDETRFAMILDNMVADGAPRIFAVVQEYGERVDGRIVAWGMAFADHADVLDVEGNIHLGLPCAQDALRGFHFGTHIKPRLIWVNPDAATPPSDDELN